MITPFGFDALETRVIRGVLSLRHPRPPIASLAAMQPILREGYVRMSEEAREGRELPSAEGARPK